MAIAPLFVIVALWTNLTRLLSIKIIATVIWVFSVYLVFALGNLQTKLDNATWTLTYATQRDTDYVKCLDKNSKDFDKMIEDCVIPNVKLLRDTYDM